MGAGRSRLSQADPLMDIPCSGITETSVHHVIVEVFYIGQTSSVFCEKGRYYLSGHYVFKRTIPNCQSAIYSRVSHLQFFLISLLFQAGIYSGHTKEQEKYRSYMFYVSIFQRFWTFVLYNYTFVAFSNEIITN